MLKKSSETERKIKTRIFKRRERRVKIIPNKRLKPKAIITGITENPAAQFFIYSFVHR